MCAESPTPARSPTPTQPLLWRGRRCRLLGSDRPNGKVVFWAETEEEAAYTVRVFLELTQATYNRRIITDAELALPEERREQLRDEINATL